MKTRQALVAAGGRATRLRASGIEVPIAKSFLEYRGRPLLYWCLNALGRAGISNLIIAADNSRAMDKSIEVVSSLPGSFDEVAFFRDAGLGMHGIPFQAKHKLDKSFIFECGHNVCAPDIYQQMDLLKTESDVVFTAFRPHPSNPRQPVLLSNKSVSLTTIDDPNRRVLSHPFLIDQTYAAKLPELDFDIVRVMADYAGRSALRFVWSSSVPEFDTRDEMDTFLGQAGSAPAVSC